MNNTGWSAELESVVSEARSRPTYWAELVKLRVAATLRELMVTRDLSGRELARKLNKSEAHVSKLLRGDKNLTIDTIVEVAHQLNGRVDIQITPEEFADVSVPVFNAPTFVLDSAKQMTSAEAQRFFYGSSQSEVLADFACNDPTFNSYELTAASA